MPRRSVLLLGAVAAGLCLTPTPQLIAVDESLKRVPARVAGSAPVVDAEVLGVSVVRRANGQRVVFTELLTDETIRVEVRIIRYRAILVRKTVRRLKSGRWAVVLSLPAALAPGRARAQVRLQDSSGAVAWYGQPIRIPAAAG